jgi:hypothetical protein
MKVVWKVLSVANLWGESCVMRRRWPYELQEEHSRLKSSKCKGTEAGGTGEKEATAVGSMWLSLLSGRQWREMGLKRKAEDKDAGPADLASSLSGLGSQWSLRMGHQWGRGPFVRFPQEVLAPAFHSGRHWSSARSSNLSKLTQLGRDGPTWPELHACMQRKSSKADFESHTQLWKVQNLVEETRVIQEAQFK